MKPINYILLLSLMLFISGSAYSVTDVKIIPQPNNIEYYNELHTLKSGVSVIADNDLQNEARFLADILTKGFGKESKIKTKGNGIFLILDEGLNSQTGSEGYVFSSVGKNITIKAATPTGIFYGIQTLKQLFPVEFEQRIKERSVKIPSVKISDYPRFHWRAFMLDESRHFKGMDEVKRLLDQMALLKMNIFHWHLTDDQGWRIEIKKYPLLTQIGSKRKDTQTSRGSENRTGKPHEGFYTQEQIKDIISYAEKRHITIVPEIEMPGHAMAAIASYPWIGSLGTTTEVPVVFSRTEDSFNISDPKVIDFLKDILNEVINLFPGKVIHIGGDEVVFKTWEESQKVQDYMKQLNIKSPIELQIYFTNLMSNYIDSKGKRMMGWNEILGDDIHGERNDANTNKDQKLAKSAIVHFWKGNLDLINKAVQNDYDVVNSNHWDTYLDYTYERLPLSKSYAFNPIPEGLAPKYQSHILGLGTQMWSEWIPTVESMEKQVFPRFAAYAEVGWTELKNKDYSRFLNSLELLKKRWDIEHIYYTDSATKKTSDARTKYFPKQEIPVSQLPSKDKLWIFIMAGQSNMAGRGWVSPYDTVPRPNIITINSKNEWVLAKEPLHFYQPNLTGLDCGLSFAKYLADSINDDITIAILPTAVGGSSISYWLNDSVFNGVHLQSNLFEKIKLAKQYGVLKGILWHQGESDASPKKIPAYKKNLEKLFSLIRQRAGNENLPIIAGELGSYSKKEKDKKNWAAINKIIHKVADKDENTYLVKTGDLTPNDDFIHFDAPSQRKLGERYAKAYLQIERKVSAQQQTAGTNNVYKETETKKNERIISFSGYKWAVASSKGKKYGGPFYYSDSNNNVWIDKNGKLHLKITHRNDKWYCAKVTLLKPVTYGKYIFQIDSRIDNFDKNVVGGLFIYKNDVQEIDIEFSKWGIDENMNSQFVIQPGDKNENKKRYDINLTENKSTHWFDWQPNSIKFMSYQGHSHKLSNSGNIFQQWEYSGEDIPLDSDEQVKINLWMFRGMPPSDNKETEMIVSAFKIE
ncbi:Beta-N-acetylhexosaminidase, family GH20 (modular protein) [uncultured Paludibacter sp.]|nr:Beta-N-acetylhexosaminidase, family GH20 (modular protein) [uncultured Paludibacter sp.]